MEKTKLTIDAYDKNYAAYESKFMQYEPYSQKIAEFLDLLPENAKVLDLGCGPGNVARQLIAADKNLTVVGVDLSEAMVKSARAHVPQGTFFVQDVREAVFPDEHFDAILLSFCIVHLSDQETYELIAKAGRWLMKGGLLYVSYMEGKSPGFEITSFSPDRIFFNYFDTAKLEGCLKQQGISLLRILRQGYPETDGSITTDVFIFGKKDDR